MKLWVGTLVMGFTLMACSPSAQAFQLQDLLSVKNANPIEVWKKMRPQDFVGAPTIWQLIV
jgi:hypothetical protein